MSDLRYGGGGRRLRAIRQAVRTDVRRPTQLVEGIVVSPAPVCCAAPELLEGRRLLSTYYVSSAGADSAAGSLESPFRTIQRAADVAKPGDTVLVRGGTYRETVTPARSGTSAARITYKPYPGERVTISGADRVTGWAAHGGSVYKAPQGWDLGDGANQVFLDGRMMIEARWPNTTLDVSRPRKATADDIDASGSSATIRDDALSHGDDYWNGAKIHFEPGEGWVGQTGKVTDSAPGRVSFSYRSMGRKAGPETGDTYYLSGKFKALDSAGEWFRDDDGTLFLWSPESDNPAGHTVEAKRRDHAFVLNDREYLTIEGFDVFAAGIISDSGSSHLRLTGLTASYLSHWSIQASGWEQPHDTGIFLDGEDNVITDSVVAYSAGHGIVLSGSNSRAENNVVHDVAYNAGDSAAIRTVGSGHVITRNTVYNTGRSALKLSNSTSLKVTHNLVHDAMLQTTDGGAIYTFGMDGRGTEIAYNKIYNVKTGGYGGTGIFLDNSSSNYVVHHNVVYNVNHALKLNYTSKGHKIYNNTLSGTDDSVGSSSSSNMSGTVFKNNIFTSTVKIAGNASESSNLYADTDARFSDGDRGDFSLKSSSPAVDRGVTLSPYTNGYGGSAPDIGALEYGRGEFRAGANLSVRTPVVPPPVQGSDGPGAGGDPGTDPSLPPPVVEVPPGPPAPPAPPPEGISVGEVSIVRLPERLVGGQRAARGRVAVVLRNDGTTPAAGPVALALHASADGVVSPESDLLLGGTRRRVKLAPGETRTVSLRMRFAPPANGGNFLLLASAAGAPVSTRNLSQGAVPVRVEAPLVDLAGPPALAEPLSFGRRVALTVPLTNRGNVTADDPLEIELRASPDGSFDRSVILGTLTTRGARIRAGDTKPLRLTFKLADPLPALTPGTYTILARVATTGQILTTASITIP